MSRRATREVTALARTHFASVEQEATALGFALFARKARARDQRASGT